MMQYLITAGSTFQPNSQCSQICSQISPIFSFSIRPSSPKHMTPTPIQSSNEFLFQVNPSNDDALHSPPQVGGNSHVHDEDENQDILLEVEQERPPTHKGAW